jgi:uncharacterized protein
MKLQSVNNHDYSIENYDQQKQQVQIQKQIYTQSLIVYQQNMHILNIDNVQALKAEDIDICIQYQPELLIIGTGITQHFISPAIYANYLKHKMGVECMTNAAACRTYNVLLSEDRNVALVLIFKNNFLYLINS